MIARAPGTSTWACARSCLKLFNDPPLSYMNWPKIMSICTRSSGERRTELQESAPAPDSSQLRKDFHVCARSRAVPGSTRRMSRKTQRRPRGSCFSRPGLRSFANPSSSALSAANNVKRSAISQPTSIAGTGACKQSCEAARISLGELCPRDTCSFVPSSEDFVRRRCIRRASSFL